MWLYNVLLIFIGIANIILVSNKTCESEYLQYCGRLAINAKKLYLMLVFFPILMISALRSINIGNDTDLYHYIFNISTYSSLSDFVQLNAYRWEKGFLIFTKVLSNISDNPQLLIATSSVISLFFVGRFIFKYSKNPALSVFLFITMRFYFFFMSNIRQSIAIGLILFSYDYIKKEKILPFTIIVLIAAQFHSTAIVFLFAYFIDKVKYSKKAIISIIVGTILVFVGFEFFIGMFLNIAPSKYINYVNTSYYTNAMNFGNIANFMITLAVLLLSYIFKYYRIKDNENKDESKDIPYYFLLISACLGLLSIKFAMFSRIQHYFYIFFIALIPNIVNKISDKYTKIIIGLIIILCFFLYHITILVLRPEWQYVYPYELFF